MTRRVGGVLAAVVLAIVGTLLLVGYVESAKERAVSGELQVDVVVVSQKVPKGTPASLVAGSVKLEKVPDRARAEGALTSLAQVSELGDKVAAVELLAGEQVLSSRFVSAQAARGAEVPAGKLLVTVSLEPERAIGGQLRPGDTVALLESYAPFEAAESGGGGTTKTPNVTSLILHKVLVTAVQVAGEDEAALGRKSGEQRTSTGAGVTAAPAGKVLVTLALDAQSVERVVFGAEYGTLWLAVEPPEAPSTPGSRITRGNVL